jgi:hypothetical protein
MGLSQSEGLSHCFAMRWLAFVVPTQTWLARNRTSSPSSLCDYTFLAPIARSLYDLHWVRDVVQLQLGSVVSTQRVTAVPNIPRFHSTDRFPVGRSPHPSSFLVWRLVLRCYAQSDRFQ